MPANNIKVVIEEMKQELTDYLKTKGELLQLKAAEKGSPLLAKGIHSGLLLVLIIIDACIALTTAIFALSLLFVEVGTEPFAALRGITLGAVCLLAFFVLITLIMVFLKKNVTEKIEEQCLSKVLDQLESAEKLRTSEQMKEQTQPIHLASSTDDRPTNMPPQV